MTYVWEVMRDAFTEIGSMQFGTESSGGSATVLTDSTLALSTDGLAGGTAFVLSAGGASPEGKFVKIASNTATAITVSTLTDNIDTGDIWGYISKEFPTEALLTLMNIGLDYIGMIGAQDTSITTADNQTEYTFPADLKYGEVQSVYIQGKTTDANDNQWYPLRNWHIQPAVAGDTVIVIPQFSSGRNIMIEYTGLHADVTAYNSLIHESIHPELAKAAFILALQNRRAEQAIGSQDSFNLLYNKGRDNYERIKALHPVWLPDRKPRRIRVFDSDVSRLYKSKPNEVRL